MVGSVDVLDLAMNFLYDMSIIVAIPLIIGFILKWLGNAAMSARRGVSNKGGVAVFSIIGTPIHELSHALVAIIFGHKINKLVLYIPPNERTNTLGYVNHSYNPNNLYQRVGLFFIGTAPVYGGVAVVYLLTMLMMPSMYTELVESAKAGVSLGLSGLINTQLLLDQLVNTFGIIFNYENFTNFWYYIYLYLSIAIVSEIRLSKPDLEGAFTGLITLSAIVGVLEVGKYLLINPKPLLDNSVNNPIFAINLIFTQLSLVSIVFAIIGFILSYIVLTVSRK